MNITQHIHHILHKIVQLQHENGSIPGSSSSLFGTLLTATILSELPSYQQAKDITGKIFPYILSHQRDDGSFSYWEHGSIEEAVTPYPPDLDDTALAMAFLLRNHSKQCDGAMLAKFTKLLTRAEISEGGPYNTWLAEENEQWRDIDLGVNANIAYALKELGIELPNLQALFETAIQEGDYRSKYYHLPLVLLFFLSRSYSGTYVEQAVRFIFRAQNSDGCWGTYTETALALCALANFNCPIARHTAAISFLITHKPIQDPLYVEQMQNDNVSFYANDAVSLALAACALSRYEIEIRRQPIEPDENIPYEAIAMHCLQECDSVSKSFASTAKRCIEKLLAEPISRDSLALPYRLQPLLHTRIPEELVFKLSTAQLFGILGYTIIDSILDEDQNVEQLPFALYCIHMFTLQYKTLFPDSSFFMETMDQTAIAFEHEQHSRLQRTEAGFLLSTLHTCTPPSWQKSYGLVLPFFGMLTLCGEKTDSAASFFQAYLHAKQLHDDAHDYNDDLNKGRVTIVGKLLLEKFMASHATHTYVLPQDATEFRTLFWNDCFPAIFSTINESLAVARTYLACLPLKSTSFLEHMVNKIENAQTHANQERIRMQSFLKTY